MEGERYIGKGWRPADTNMELEITAEKLVYGGRRAGAPTEGRVVLVPSLRRASARRVEVVTSKPDLRNAACRAARASPSASPACPHFGVCGGCHYQHAALPGATGRQRRNPAEVFHSGSASSPPGVNRKPSRPSGATAIASNCTWPTDASATTAPPSHELCPVERCPWRRRSSRSRSRRCGGWRATRFPRFIRSLELFTDETAVQGNVIESDRRPARRFFDWLAGEIPGWRDGALDYLAAGFQFRVSHSPSFKLTGTSWSRWLDAAIGGAEGEHALDLYAGVGLFSLPLAKRFRSSRRWSPRHRRARPGSQRRARGPGGRRGDRHRRGVSRQLDTPPDFVLADPPRAGLGKHVVRRLIALVPRRLTVVSCDPATLARDLAALIGGGYRLDSVTLVDLFPHTAHIESIARLSARARNAPPLPRGRGSVSRSEPRPQECPWAAAIHQPKACGQAVWPARGRPGRPRVSLPTP